MTVITSQILDISNSTTLTFREWANNTNKIVSDVVNVNNDVTSLSANVNVLKITVSTISSSVSSLITSVNTINVVAADPTVVGIAALAADGFIAKIGNTGVTARSILTGGPGLSVINGSGFNGNPTISLTNDIAALENLNGTGIAVRTSNDTWAQRTIVGPAVGVTISNGDGINGNPTISLSGDLAALEASASFGIAVRTAADTWTQRAIVGSSTGGITVNNADGVNGNPTIALVNDLAALENLASTGLAVRIADDTWAQRSVAGTTGEITVTNGNGVLGNPTLSLPASLNFTGKTITPGVTIGFMPVRAGVTGNAHVQYQNNAGTVVGYCYYDITNSSMVLLNSISGGTIQVLSNGNSVVSGQLQINQNLSSATAAVVVGCTGAGSVYLRPNGVGSGVGQLVVDSAGNASLNGAFIVTTTNGQIGATVAAMGVGGIGAYAFLRSTVGAVGPGGVVAGTGLLWSCAGADNGGSVGFGTWRCMGNVVSNGSQSLTTLWLRIA